MGKRHLDPDLISNWHRRESLMQVYIQRKKDGIKSVYERGTPQRTCRWAFDLTDRDEVVHGLAGHRLANEKEAS